MLAGNLRKLCLSRALFLTMPESDLTPKLNHIKTTSNPKLILSQDKYEKTRTGGRVLAQIFRLPFKKQVNTPDDFSYEL